MPGEPLKKKGARKRVVFSLDAPDAGEVSLMGDFNGWDRTAHPMKRDEKGIWKKAVVIAPGTYEYKFLVDGQWWNDPGNEETVPNRYGTTNNVLCIG